MELRDFSVRNAGVQALICAPFALHYPTVADFAPGHSIVEALRDGGVDRIFVTDWRSASAEMRFLTIDNDLADLNVAVDDLGSDDLGSPVDLIGLCQGGVMAAAYAARFPHKVRRLVLAGAPIDISAGDSMISRMTAHLPPRDSVLTNGRRSCGTGTTRSGTPTLSGILITFTSIP
jgi:poly(3-hydroxyalkanoate) synthetase